MQSVYAMQQSQSQDLDKELKFLQNSANEMENLYLTLLCSLLLAVPRAYAADQTTGAEKPKRIELVLVIDKSGSMGGLESDTIGGFNSMVEKQRALHIPVRVTAVLFNDKAQTLYDHKAIWRVPPLTEKEYVTGGTTALLDAVVALGAGLNIMWTGFTLIRDSVGGLMDIAPSAEVLQRVEEVLARHRQTGMIDFHAVRVREAGNRRFMELHVLVPAAWSVKKGHDFTEQVIDELIEADTSLRISAHLEPIEDPKSYEDLEDM